MLNSVDKWSNNMNIETESPEEKEVFDKISEGKWVWDLNKVYADKYRKGYLKELNNIPLEDRDAYFLGKWYNTNCPQCSLDTTRVTGYACNMVDCPYGRVVC